MSKKNNPRKRTRQKDRIDRKNYAGSLGLHPVDGTEKEASTLSSDSSTFKQRERPKKTKKRPKKRKSASKKTSDHIKKNWVNYLISGLWVIACFLFLNDYNFNADLKVAENKILNIEKRITEYKESGIISKEEYQNFENEIEKIKNTYSKLDKVNKLEKDLEILKISTEKDLENLKNS